MRLPGCRFISVRRSGRASRYAFAIALKACPYRRLRFGQIASREPRRFSLRRRSVDELDLGPPVDHLRQRLRVPVGEVDAAVRLGLADGLRVRSAVDAVVVAETDPRGADRIHGTRGDVEGLLRLHSLELELRTVVVGGVSWLWQKRRTART